jgi:hypothetical protein
VVRGDGCWRMADGADEGCVLNIEGSGFRDQAAEGLGGNSGLVDRKGESQD